MCVTNQAGRLDMHMTNRIIILCGKVLNMLNIGLHNNLCKAASSEVWANILAMRDCCSRHKRHRQQNAFV